MSLVWLPLLGLGVAVLAVFLVVRRLRETREHADRLGSTLAAVLGGYAAGLSVWDVDSRLVACNQRFREFYPGVPLKPGLVLEDLTRFTVTRGLVQVPEDEVEAWVLDRMTRFRGVAREVVRTASGRWLEIRSMPTDHGEVLLLYADATETHDTRSALSDRSERLDQQSADLALLRRAVELAGVAESFDGGGTAGRRSHLRVGRLAGRTRVPSVLNGCRPARVDACVAFGAGRAVRAVPGSG